MADNCAPRLRIGEGRRDASDKIRGFLFQDLITIKLLLTHDESYNCYVEYVEDIFFENESEILVIQVKYYPRSTVDFPKIYSDMYYQFLKFKLLDSNKELKTFCFHHSQSTFLASECKESVKQECSENDIDTVDKQGISALLKDASNHEGRKRILFENFSSSSFLNEFSLNCESQISIDRVREELSNDLFNIFNSCDVIRNMSQDYAKNMLSALAIDYIQKSYYIDSDDAEERKISKRDFIADIYDTLSNDNDVNCLRIIKSIIFSCIDTVLVDILHTEDDIAVLEKYNKMYIETKKYFDNALNRKELRYKLLNTVSSENQIKLNFGLYRDYTNENEKDAYLLNSERIVEYFRYLWKIIFNLEDNCNNIHIEDYLLVNDDCFLFTCPLEQCRPVLISSYVSPGSKQRHAENILSRVKKMNFKPSKWYLGGFKGICYYSYNIDSIPVSENSKDLLYQIDDFDQQTFQVECLKCLKCDIREMGKKDENLIDGLFSINCIDEV